MLFETLYIEESVVNHDTTKEMTQRFPKTRQVICQHYGEIFNRRRQNFRLQKQHPSIILAQKLGKKIIPSPLEYAIGGEHNFYFSHMLNCIYDCRYCFLQGMYPSAHFVHFVNDADFFEEIERTLTLFPKKTVYFYSGYDCDSLALDHLTHFTQRYLPFFRKNPNAFLELRTKSINIHHLLKIPPLDNCVVAFTLAPDPLAKRFENRAPQIHQRIRAIQKLQEKGWKIGLRLDPLIHHKNFKENYTSFFQTLFGQIEVQTIHSVNMGVFRLPKHNYKTMTNLYPDEPLFAAGLSEKKGIISYQEEKEKELFDFCEHELLQYIPKSIYFPCKL